MTRRRLYIGKRQDIYCDIHYNNQCQKLVIFCYPFPHEVTRVRWFIERMKTHLLKRNIASISFDYRHTGDSFGRSDEMTLETIKQDIQVISSYARQHFPNLTRDFVAFRMPASILLSSSSLIDCNMTLIDPIANGLDYFETMRLIQTEFINHDPNQAPIARNGLSDSQVLGFPLSHTLTHELQHFLTNDKSLSDHHHIISTGDYRESLKLSHVESPLYSKINDQLEWHSHWHLRMQAMPQVLQKFLIDRLEKAS